MPKPQAKDHIPQNNPDVAVDPGPQNKPVLTPNHLTNGQKGDMQELAATATHTKVNKDNTTEEVALNWHHVKRDMRFIDENNHREQDEEDIQEVLIAISPDGKTRYTIIPDVEPKPKKKGKVIKESV